MNNFFKMIPAWCYKAAQDEYRSEYLHAIEEVFSSGQFLFGKQLTEFEQEFSSFIGTQYGIGCDNATNGLFLSLKALNIGSGDKVITVANTAIPTVSAICQSGATPVFCDVGDDGLIDLATFDISRYSSIKAIIPVHLFGFPCNMQQVLDFAEENNLFVIEDCSQAHGATYRNSYVGSFGHISVFSFYPTKPLGGFGDAGIILTNSDQLNARLRRLRFYGIDSDYYAEEVGFNSRMDEIHAAILRRKLPRLLQNIRHRAKVADIYKSVISSDALLALVSLPNSTPSHYLIPFIYKGNRDKFRIRLEKEGVFANVSYKHPVHLMNGFSHLGYAVGHLPKSEYLCDHVISFPVFDGISFDDVRYISGLVNKLA
jgi:dTDP-4-amino-4,6-dideoxygalactose transaminase